VKKGGLVVRADGALCFVPAHVARAVAPPPVIAKVAGAPSSLLGIAAHEGEIIPVVAVGPSRSTLVVCQHMGELLGVVGIDVLDAGIFDGDGDGVIWKGEKARPLDLGAVYARVQSAAWAGRWAV
jgi:hypothetical protein